MCTTDKEVCRLQNMFCKYIVFKGKILFYCCVGHFHLEMLLNYICYGTLLV